MTPEIKTINTLILQLYDTIADYIQAHKKDPNNHKSHFQVLSYLNPILKWTSQMIEHKDIKL